MKKWLIYVLVSATLVAMLLAQINIQDLGIAFSNVNYFYLSIAYIFYFATYLCRSLRFRVFLGKKIGIFDMFRIVSIHNLANTILPARTGELSFIYLARNRGVKTGKGLGALAMARMFDLLVVSIFILATPFLIEKTSIFVNMIVAAVSVIFALVIIFYILIFRCRNRSIRIFGRIAKTLGIRGKFFRFFRKHIKELYASMDEARDKMWPMFLVSVLLWFIVFTANLMFLMAFNIQITFLQTVFLVSIIYLIPLIPFYGVGGFGTFEVAMSAILILFGIAKDAAIVSSFGIHISGLIFVIVVGVLFSMLNKKVDNKRRSSKMD